MINKVWKTVPTLDSMEVSSSGEIRVKVYHKEMPYGGFRTYGGTAWKGTIAFDVSRPRYVTRFRGKTYKIHRLVCEAFHGPAPEGKPDVIHINGNTLDNRPVNVRWATRSEVTSQRPFVLEDIE